MLLVTSMVWQLKESQSPQKATTSTATDQPAETTRNAIESLGGFGPVLQEYSLTSEL